MSNDPTYDEVERDAYWDSLPDAAPLVGGEPQRLAEYVRNHQCWNADRNVTIADWHRGVRAIEAEARREALREMRDEIQRYYDESAQMSSPLGAGYTPDFWAGLGHAIGMIDAPTADER